jgi:hypothetical protein
LAQVIYIGQAFDKTPRSLRNRIRWEITKDGEGCALSEFCEKCQKYGVDRLSLKLKVAHIKEARDNGTDIEHGSRLMNDIEKALIFWTARELAGALMNENGKKKRFRRGSIQIHNQGSFAPLAEWISLPKFG